MCFYNKEPWAFICCAQSVWNKDISGIHNTSLAIFIKQNISTGHIMFNIVSCYTDTRNRSVQNNSLMVEVLVLFPAS